MEHNKNQVTSPLLLVALIVAVAIPAMCGDKTASAGNAPDFDFSGPNNKSYQLSDLRDHVVVLDFWQSWCPACRNSLPALQSLNNEMRDEDVLFLGVDDEDRTTISQYSKRLGLHFFTISDDNDEIAKAYDVESIPLTVIIGRDGRVIDTVEGFEGSEDRVREAVTRALAEQSNENDPKQVGVVKQ